MHNTKQYLHTFKAGLRKQSRASMFCSSLLFCSVRDPRKVLKLDPLNSILDPRKLKLEPRNSILENFEDPESSFESRLSTYLWAVLYAVQINIKSHKLLMYHTNVHSLFYTVKGLNRAVSLMAWPGTAQIGWLWKHFRPHTLNILMEMFFPHVQHWPLKLDALINERA